MKRITILLALLAIVVAAPAIASGNGPQLDVKNNDCNGILNCNKVKLTDNSTTVGTLVDVDSVIKDNTAVLGRGNVVGNTTKIKDNTVVLGDALVGEGELNVMGGSVGDTTAKVKNSGNSDVKIKQRIVDGDVDASNKQKQRMQQKQDQKLDNDVDIDQEFSDDDVINFDNSDHSVQSIDNDFPVNTAAPVFAGNCSQGVSAQTMSMGGSIASGNPVCDYIAVAGAYIAGGAREKAFAVLEKAEDYADWRAVFGKIRMCMTLGLL